MTMPQLTTFMLIKAMPSWLRLSRPERNAIAQNALAQLKSKIRYFDAEAFNARASDIVMFQAASYLELHADIERLRDTPLFSEPYFEVTEIVPCIEEGFRWFEETELED